MKGISVIVMCCFGGPLGGQQAGLIGRVRLRGHRLKGLRGARYCLCPRQIVSALNARHVGTVWSTVSAHAHKRSFSTAFLGGLSAIGSASRSDRYSVFRTHVMPHALCGTSFLPSDATILLTNRARWHLFKHLWCAVCCTRISMVSTARVESVPKITKEEAPGRRALPIALLESGRLQPRPSDFRFPLNLPRAATPSIVSLSLFLSPFRVVRTLEPSLRRACYPRMIMTAYWMTALPCNRRVPAAPTY